MSLEDVIIHIRIEEQNKMRDKAKKAKELSSKENVVKERPRPKFHRHKRQNPRTKPNSSNNVQNPTYKKRLLLCLWQAWTPCTSMSQPKET